VQSAALQICNRLRVTGCLSAIFKFAVRRSVATANVAGEPTGNRWLYRHGWQRGDRFGYSVSAATKMAVSGFGWLAGGIITVGGGLLLLGERPNTVEN
jgi:hypothetical protein